MKRNALDQIIYWEKNQPEKALYLTGASGVGKTYLALEYARLFYEGYFYINPKGDIDLSKRLRELGDLPDQNIEVFLLDYYQLPSELLTKILFIFDDFDSDTLIINVVKRIISLTHNYQFIVISTAEPDRFFSNYCHIIRLMPLGFDEYLMATGSEWYTEIIRGHFQTNKKIPNIVHNEMLNQFRDYMRIGGMPSAVNEYLSSDNMYNISRTHRVITQTYFSDMDIFDESLSIRMKQIYRNYPEQLLKSNKKFQYSLLRKGASHKLYANAIDTLLNHHMVIIIRRAEITEDGTNQMILQENQFRLYAPDLGILNTLISSNHVNLLPESDGEDERGGDFSLLVENYLLQHLYEKNYQYCFWESGSLSKLDFLLSTKDGLVPIEIKPVENTRSKSLSAFRSRINTPYAIKISGRNFDSVNQIRNIPYYAIFCL